MKKNKRHIFPIFLAYLFILLCAGGIFLLYARKSLMLYEDAQPRYVLDALAAAISENGLHDLTLTLPDYVWQGEETGTTTDYSIAVIDDAVYTEYEDDRAFRLALDAQIAAEGVEWRFVREEYGNGAMIYALYSGEIYLGETSLLPGRSYRRMLLLTMTEWFPQDILLYREAPACGISVTMPEDHHLYINGLPVLENALVSRQPYDGLDYCREYVTLPDEVSYRIDGLYEMPQLRITDGSGTVVYDAQPDHGSEVEIGFATPVMTAALEEYVLAAAERYSLFFTKDLSGSAASIDPIRELFPEDSVYLELAERYRREDMGVVAGHSNTHFADEEVTDYTVYSTDCFSCRIRFDKLMSLGAREMVDTTDSVYYFIRQDDRWVIADIR